MATVTACPGGLSPLARGTPPLRSSTRSISRFIPAGAGNSHHDARATRQGSVYPRWRGELISPGISCSRGRGLSPLARGTRPSPVFRSFRPRFIPAGAGNSSRAIAIAIVRSVYPRWRGELYINEVNLWKLYGLSPLARGTQPDADRYRASPRFIPAGAGNSPTHCTLCRRNPVYPRWRGELSGPSIHLLNPAGLSPLARGTHHHQALPALAARFIPAGAGNSPALAGRRRAVTVYPRWRGELSKSIHLFLKHFFP